jgi:hypothetical protein
LSADDGIVVGEDGGGLVPPVEARAAARVVVDSIMTMWVPTFENASTLLQGLNRNSSALN